MAEVFPELVVRDDQGRPATVKYHLLSTLLVNELQKQRAELDEQRAEFHRQGEVIVDQQEMLELLLERVRSLEGRGARTDAELGADAALSSPLRR